MTHPPIRRLVPLTLLAGLAALCLAACGSSAASSTTSGSVAAASASGPASGAALDRTKFIACLKAHGVTLPARPAGARRPPTGTGPGGGGLFGGRGGGPRRAFATNPKLRAAIQACGGGRFRPRRFALSHLAITRFAACVKQHGYTLPAPDFSGKGPVFPARIEQNKTFQAAARACRGDLRPPGAPAPGSGGATGATATTGA